jgi:Anthranilate phosphoribosyltransferase
LVGDDANFTANQIIDIFKGEDNDFSKAVCLNAAAGLIVMEKHSIFKDSYEDARNFILTGKAYEHLKSLQNV